MKNAVKFTPPGGRIEVRCSVDSAGRAQVAVKDSGLGIDPDILPRLFRAFEQGDRQITRTYGGLGLGLAISRALVELHDGELTAASAGPGCGATFTVHLPLRPAAATPAAPTPSNGHSPGPASAPRRLRILLVEDHEDTARVMQRFLTVEGHDVQHAPDIAAALRAVEKNKGAGFDLLVSDLGLPDGSGLDLVAALRGCGHPLPAVAISGFGQEQDIKQSLASGFSAHLIKPVDVTLLQEAIAGLCGT
jgi:two-component system CheB/CheR fusion protein